MNTLRRQNRSSSHLLAAASPALLGLCAASCTTHKPFLQPATKEYVWPPPPVEPRVRFIGEISGPLTGANGQSKVNELLFGPQPSVHLVTPYGVAVDATGNLIAVADPNSHCVHVLDVQRSKYVRVDRAGEANLEGPVGVAWGTGLLFTSDPPRGAVDIFGQNQAGFAFVRTVALGSSSRPTGMAYDESRRLLYVCDSNQHQIVVLNANGEIIRTIGQPGGQEGEFRIPVAVVCSADGSIVVADSMNFRVQRFGADGDFLSAFGRKGDAAGDLSLPKGVAADHKGNFWVVDAQFENVQAFTPKGELLLALGGEGHEPGQFWLPAGAFIDKQDRMWVAATYNRRLQVFQLMP